MPSVLLETMGKKMTLQMKMVMKKMMTVIVLLIQRMEMRVMMMGSLIEDRFYCVTNQLTFLKSLYSKCMPYL